MLTLIDTENLGHTIEKYEPDKMFDFELFSKSIEGTKIAYGTARPGYDLSIRLKELGYVTKFKKISKGLLYYSPIVDIVLDTVFSHATNINLVTSNIQMLPLILYLKDRGITTMVLGINPHPLFNKHTTVSSLKGYLYDFTDSKREVWLRSNVSSHVS